MLPNAFVPPIPLLILERRGSLVFLFIVSDCPSYRLFLVTFHEDDMLFYFNDFNLLLSTLQMECGIDIHWYLQSLYMKEVNLSV
jgi:hypothetical protein